VLGNTIPTTPSLPAIRPELGLLIREPKLKIIYIWCKNQFLKVYFIKNAYILGKKKFGEKSYALVPVLPLHAIVKSVLVHVEIEKIN
jgi:hypothetical protein